MCGIVGLFAKSPEIDESLGRHLAAMLAQMDDRGPDSAGVAIYRDPAPPGSSKLTIYSFDPGMAWDALCADVAREFGGAEILDVRGRHCVLLVDADAAEADAWV